MSLYKRTICLLLAVTVFLTPTLALAQTPADGCDLYAEARFDEAISVLEQLLIRGQLDEAQTLEARSCLARAYVKSGDESGARDVFTSILAAAPNWEPDPLVVPPDEIAVFQAARTAMAQAQLEGAEPEVTPETPQPTVETAGMNEEKEDEGGSGAKKILGILGGIIAAGLIVAGLAATG